MFPKLENIMQGVKSGEITVTSTPRTAGKSIYMKLLYLEQAKLKFTEVGAFPVDGSMWHTVYCGFAIADWVRQQDASAWVEGFCDPLGMCFDVSAELYTMLVLRWS